MHTIDRFNLAVSLNTILLDTPICPAKEVDVPQVGGIAAVIIISEQAEGNSHYVQLFFYRRCDIRLDTDPNLLIFILAILARRHSLVEGLDPVLDLDLISFLYQTLIRRRRTLPSYLIASLSFSHLFKLTSEFPNNVRHPCTTMPWTIWPALVVLWGVCWMFTPNPFDSFGTVRGSFTDRSIQGEASSTSGQDFLDLLDSPHISPWNGIDDGFNRLDHDYYNPNQGVGAWSMRDNEDYYLKSSPMNQSPVVSPDESSKDKGKQPHAPTPTTSNNQNPVKFTQNGRAICNICQKTVKRKEDLERHKLGHKPGRFPCRDPSCSNRKPFTREDNRNNHERMFHSAVLSQPPEPQTTTQSPNDRPGNVTPTPQRRPNRKRPRDEPHADQDASIEDVHEKCRRLEARMTQLEYTERENQQLKIENKQMKAENEQLKIEMGVYKSIVSEHMKQGRR